VTAADELRTAACALRARAAKTEAGLTAALREGTRDLFGKATPDRGAMHPEVGGALADWLEQEAAGHEAVQGLGDITTELINVQLEQVGYGAQITHSTLPQALAVARAILGTQETP
jgi:hypothetical protein